MVARLSCILMHTGVASSGVVRESFFEKYTRALVEASPEFPLHFLKIYSECSGWSLSPVPRPGLRAGQGAPGVSEMKTSQRC